MKNDCLFVMAHLDIAVLRKKSIGHYLPVEIKINFFYRFFSLIQGFTEKSFIKTCVVIRKLIRY